jgi:hypothetical protein
LINVKNPEPNISCLGPFKEMRYGSVLNGQDAPLDLLAIIMAINSSTYLHKKQS